MELLREVYWEAKRAPSTDMASLRSPYRKEVIRKNQLGKTREERLKKLEWLKEMEKKRI